MTTPAPTRFGVRLPVNGPLASSDAIRRVAELAETLGYDAVWAHDLIGWTAEQQSKVVYCGSVESSAGDPNMFEPLTVLTHLSGSTEHIRLGTSILALPLRHPVVLARQLASLDALSGGRLTLGVGVGSTDRPVSDYEISGTAREGRYRRMREHLEVLQAAWYSDRVSYEGEFLQLPETTIRPGPIQQPLPVWFGGSGDQTLELLSVYGHGWLPSWADPGLYRKRLPILYERLSAHDRAPSEITIGKDCYIALDDDANTAHRWSEPTVRQLLDRFGHDARERKAASMLIGDPQQVKEQIELHRAVGVTDIEMKFIYHDIDHLSEQMHCFARDVAPAFA